ncbi:MAG: penicillin-binding protein 2 [Verrucomicrobia bacterium]|nr:penicillin-binding protein 2 [Verrucomicrobiota bacterium]MCH8510875.1 penicillin-binding protein 2 [Kiritimatiellia bacterium]
MKKISGLRLRAGLTGLFFLTLFGGLAARVVHLQLGDHTELRLTYQRRVIHREDLKASRGSVRDRNGRLLALDESRKHVGVDPSFIHAHNNPQLVHAALSRFLHVEPAMIGARLQETNRRFAYLERFVEEYRAEELDAYLREHSLRNGVVLETINTRSYPHGNLLSHVVGFVNREDVGSAGVEQTMHRFLQSRGGIRVSEKDGRRREMASRRSLQIDPTDGADVTLTVDLFLQHGVEEALEKALKQYNAAGGWALVMDVKTGEILAMASRPDYDPNAFNRTPSEHMRNRNVTGSYEPGSIFKGLVFAAALNEGLVEPTEIIDCEYGVWIHRNRPLRDYHPYARLTAEEVLHKSSNIGTAKIALRMAPEMMHDYLRKFGFGQRTGIDLPGEESGIMHDPRNWDSLTHSRMSIGHAVNVTAVQMAAAMNAIANDGVLMRPYVVREVRSPSGDLLFKRHPEEAGPPVVRPEVAREMRRMLAGVTRPGGTGRRAAIEGFEIAGKTGTAQKVLPGGGYAEKLNVASFVGFLPAQNPVVTILVSIDEPQGELRTGGSVAAPVFKEIAEYAIGYYGIPPEGF